MKITGRFGNQADHFLGALGFAKSLNRTLVLPPWVEYRQGELRSRQVPFETYFNVDALQTFHRVITMHRFMQEFSPIIWPPEKRVAFCYMERKSLNGNSEQSCNAKEGNIVKTVIHFPYYDIVMLQVILSDRSGIHSTLNSWIRSSLDH